MDFCSADRYSDNPQKKEYKITFFIYAILTRKHRSMYNSDVNKMSVLIYINQNIIIKGAIKMAKSKIVKSVEKIEKGVTEGYKKIEDSVVGSYTKIEDKFVDTFLTKNGETVEEAKERLKKEAGKY